MALLAAAPRPSSAPGIDRLKLVVPEQLGAPVVQAHVEREVARVAPRSDDRARKPLPLRAPCGLAHHDPRAEACHFGPHNEPTQQASFPPLPGSWPHPRPRRKSLGRRDRPAVRRRRGLASPFPIAPLSYKGAPKSVLSGTKCPGARSRRLARRMVFPLPSRSERVPSSSHLLARCPSSGAGIPCGPRGGSEAVRVSLGTRCATAQTPYTTLDTLDT